MRKAVLPMFKMAKIRNAYAYLIVLAVICGIWGRRTFLNQEPRDGGNNTANRHIDVMTINASKIELFDPLVFGGFIQSSKSQVIVSEVQGSIDTYHVRLGQWVNRNQPLFSVRPIGQGFDYNKNIVRSPISGHVTNIYIDEGKNLELHQPVVSVADLHALKMDIHVAQDDLQHIKINDSIELKYTPRIQPVSAILGKVNAISPASDPDTGTFRVQIEINCNSAIKPSPCSTIPIGSYAQAIKKKNTRFGYLLPRNAVSLTETKILIVKNRKRLEWINVRLGKFIGEDVEIIEGINEGDKIVTSYAKYPKNGDIARITTIGKEQQKILNHGKKSASTRSTNSKSQ